MRILNKSTIISYQNWHKNHSQYATSTSSLYFRITLNFLHYLESRNISYLNSVNADKIKEFICFRKGRPPYSPASVKVRESALHLFFSWAVSKKLARENPVVLHKRLKIISKKIPLINTSVKMRNLISLNANEQKILLNHSVDDNFFAVRNRCIVTFLLASGLFTEELIKLSIKNVHLRESYIEIKGNKRTRKVYFDAKLCRKDYKKWLGMHPLKGQSTSPLFVTLNCKPLSGRALYNIISEYLQSIEISKKAGPNILRKTAIINALQEDSNLEKIQKNFGIQTYEHIKTYFLI